MSVHYFKFFALPDVSDRERNYRFHVISQRGFWCVEYPPSFIIIRKTICVAALESRAWLGREEKINAYCHDLAINGGKRLAELFGTRVMDPDGKFTLNMVR